MVYSYDTVTGTVTQQEVITTFAREADHLNYLTIVDENGESQIIETTDSHPFWVVTDEPDLGRAARTVVDENGVILYHENLESNLNGFWVEAKDLQEGDIFLGASGELSTLVTSERVVFPNGVKVYNFTVEGNHDYFVLTETDEFGQTCILVHNGNCTNQPTLPPKTIIEQNGVRIERYTNDHLPPHVHVKGGGEQTRISANGKPLSGDPELLNLQRQVVNENLSLIRAAVNKIRRWFNWNNGH